MIKGISAHEYLRQKLWAELKDQGDPFIGGWTEGQLLKGRKV